ncbi:MAG: DUF4097 family beta strand repeat protein, partial [Clostridia bacterium]|nr:DUF4097 family beta strand repeat protein [Clostridia bacterium]
KWDFTSIGNVKPVESEFEITEPFRNISIRTDTEKLLICKSADGKFRVKFMEPEYIEPSVSVQNGTLMVSRTDNRSWTDRIGISFGIDSYITVELPYGSYGTLSIAEDTGTVIVNPNFTFDRIDIAATTGDVFCYASSDGPVQIAAHSGEIKATDISAESFVVSVTTGGIFLDGVTCHEDLTVTVDTGKTILNNISCRNFLTTGDTGSLSVEKLTASGMISVERTTGDVAILTSDAQELNIATDTGDVRGSLLTDKIFIVQSDTGEIHVPETTSGGVCRITTDTGDIHFRIGE